VPRQGAYTLSVFYKARIARWTPYLNRYAEVAPACCNACRTCTTTNVLTLLGMVGGVLAAPFARVARFARRS